MARKIRYPIGIQTFSKIVLGDYLYVDKTELVYELTHRYDYVFLSRPRRFGKSLLMSTLEAYFRGEKELFKNLAIENLEKEWKTYPVFGFDLSPANFDNPSRLIAYIEVCLKNIENEYSLNAEGEDISTRLISLIQQAYQKYQEKVVILIDEYDKPMLDCIHDPEIHSRLKAELRSFYSAIKSSDRYIKFAMLTG
ncbi:MAG: AAA family ATPase, partial [Muribaculaceae bacterium]|nr:AAA family ATPase [Muribaculaceae bacterium]